MKPEQYHQPTDEVMFREYFDNLKLKPEDFTDKDFKDKEILDIGSGSAQFAKWAKEHKLNANIYSLDPKAEFSHQEKVVKAKSEALPFKDESFDLILSYASIPQVFSGKEYQKNGHDLIIRSIEEMLRVLRPEGEVRFGPVIDKKVQDLVREILSRKKVLKIEEFSHSYQPVIYFKVKKINDKIQ